MKIRLTIMAENDQPRTEELTEEKVVAAWQMVLSMLCLGSENRDKVVVESAEFIEGGQDNGTA